MVWRKKPGLEGCYISVLFGCCGRRIDGPGLLGGLIIYQGHLFRCVGLMKLLAQGICDLPHCPHGLLDGDFGD